MYVYTHTNYNTVTLSHLCTPLFNTFTPKICQKIPTFSKIILVGKTDESCQHLPKIDNICKKKVPQFAVR